MTTARVTAILLDGSKHEATGIFRALTDKVAWEREFKTSFVSFQRDVGASVEDGQIRKDADLSSLTAEREAFLPWRLLHREKAFTATFEEFLDNVEALEVEVIEGDGVDPTVPAPLPIDSRPSPSSSE